MNKKIYKNHASFLFLATNHNTNIEKKSQYNYSAVGLFFN